MTAMPDARRLAMRSIAVCRNLGMSEAQARSTVTKVASLVIQDLLSQGVRNIDWPYEVLLWARGATADDIAAAAEDDVDGPPSRPLYPAPVSPRVRQRP